MSGLLGVNTFINPNFTRICNPNTRYPFPHRTCTNLRLNNHHHCIINATNLSSSSSNKALILRRFSSMATASPSASTEESKPFSVLFVCLGNICRSPAAEAVFRNLVEKRGLASKFRIDSAGTIGYHEGDKADPRMRAASKNRGIEVTSISRPINPSDFRDFDLILAMDLQNREDIMNAYERWRFKEPLPPDAPNKVKLMCSYCKKHSEREVPDPYYGGAKGFEKVLDLLEDACESLLDSIVQSQNASTSAST
ncbi:Low molecular weight protein-tyrosine-phosphatase [Rhynchospora pubera]|uniref:acid phosphatase n=1 Tax=Rhynchospora pubera TaxID=906938 RepID=A0AAV8G9K5_9POAL|nr:Low molecular weight protein-tyrosine-phosphatase [Rhynchospora pubera]